MISTWGTTAWWTSGAGSRLGLLHNPWQNCTTTQQTTQQEKDPSVLPSLVVKLSGHRVHILINWSWSLRADGSRAFSQAIELILCSSCKRKHPNADHYMLSLGTDWFMGLEVLFPVSMPQCMRPGQGKHTHGTSNAEQQLITTDLMMVTTCGTTTTTLYGDGVRLGRRWCTASLCDGVRRSWCDDDE